MSTCHWHFVEKNNWLKCLSRWGERNRLIPRIARLYEGLLKTPVPRPPSVSYHLIHCVLNGKVGKQCLD